jgi:hypothetical protein
MIQIATFTRKFFIELVKQLQIYGTLYVTEDGNIYVNESQAQTRCQSREKLAHLNGELVQELRYARVDKSNPPKDTAEFEEMLENQFTPSGSQELPGRGREGTQQARHVRCRGRSPARRQDPRS